MVIRWYYHIYMYTHNKYAYTYMHTYTCTHIRTLINSVENRTSPSHQKGTHFVGECIYTYIYIYIYMYIYKYIYIYTYIHIQNTYISLTIWTYAHNFVEFCVHIYMFIDARYDVKTIALCKRGVDFVRECTISRLLKIIGLFCRILSLL